MRSILSLGDFGASRGHSNQYQQLSRLVVLVLIASSLLVWPLTNTVHADDPMPYGEYRALVVRAYQDARAARSQPRSKCAATLNHIADELEAVTAVRMPNGTVMPVEHCCGIDEALRAAPCDTARAEAYLVGICPGCINQANGSSIEEPWLTLNVGGGQSGDQGTGDGEQGQPSGDVERPDGQRDGQSGERQPSGDGEQSDEQRDGQIGQGQPSGDGEQTDERGDGQGEQGQPSGDGGQSDEQGDGQSGQDRPLGDGDSAATDQFGRQGSGGDDQDQPDGQEPDGDDQDQPLKQAKEIPPAMWLVVILGSLLLVVGLAALWMHRAPEPETDPDDAGEEEVTAVAEEDVTSLVEAVDRAQQLVAIRDYRTAVRYLFLAALRTLDERELIRFDHNLTNREMLRDAQANPTLSAVLTPVTAAFDRIWYGFEPLTQPDYETLVEQIESLSQL
jgi:hypothetical protein